MSRAARAERAEVTMTPTQRMDPIYPEGGHALARAILRVAGKAS